MTATVAASLPTQRTNTAAPVALVPIGFDLNDWGSWRPVPVESVQASMTSPGLARLLSTPFLANGVARGDRVAISSHGAGWSVDALVEPSDVSVLRVFAGSREELAPAMSALAELGLSTRRHSRFGIAVVEVPAGRSLDSAIELTRRHCHPLTVVEISCRREVVR